MKRILIALVTIMAAIQLMGCTVISAVATSKRMEDARMTNVGKQLVPKDSESYIIPIGTETVSYLGSGDSDWKINNSSFTQPKGTYSIIKSAPGIYNIYGNKRVVGGGEATSIIELKTNEAVCFYVFNPITGSARIESYKGDACDPILRSLKNLNITDKIY